MTAETKSTARCCWPPGIRRAVGLGYLAALHVVVVVCVLISFYD